MLLAWGLFAAGWFGWLAWNRSQREAVGAIPFLAAVAAAIYFLFPLLEVPQVGLPIRGYGAMLLLAVLLGVSTAAHRAQQVGNEPDRIYSLAFWMFVSGIAGARLFYVIQNWSSFPQGNPLATLIEVLKFMEGGLVVYGSLIGAVLAFVVFARRYQLSLWELADLVAPSLVLGLAVGRIGCLLNGCCYGGICDEGSPRITFPQQAVAADPQFSPPYHHQLAFGQIHGLRLAASEADRGWVIAEVVPGSAAARAGVVAGMHVRAVNGIEDRNETKQLLGAATRQLRLTTSTGETVEVPLQVLPPRSLPVHPAQIYATINAFLIFLVAWFFFPFRRRQGEVFGLVLTVYPVTRILLEWVRVDEGGWYGTTLTISQLISLLILLLMVPYWAGVRRTERIAAA